MAHKDPHVDHSPDPRVDLCDPCVDLCEPRGDSRTDDPRVDRSDPCVAQVFLQCRMLLSAIIIMVLRLVNIVAQSP